MQKRHSLKIPRKAENEPSGLKLNLNKCPSFTEINQQPQCKSNHSNDKEMFTNPKLGANVSLLKAYSLKKSSCFSNLDNSESPSTLIKHSTKRRKVRKKRKNTKVPYSQIQKSSETDSFKFSLFRVDQMGEMIHSLSNLGSNQSQNSSTTLSPSPSKRMKD